MSSKEHSHRHRKHHENHRILSSTTSANGTITSSTDVLFTTDRKGDIQNLRYGSIDKYKVPKYRTVGYGRLLGLDRRFKITTTSQTERRVDDDALDTSSKNHSFPSLLRRQAVDEASTLNKFEPTQDDDFSEQASYIPFGRKRRKISKSNGNEGDGFPPGVIDTSDSDPSSGSDSTSSEDVPDVHQFKDEDAFEQFKNHPDNKKYIELRRKTERDPQDVDAWLSLIDHQERYFSLTSGNGRANINTSQTRAVTDMKVSLYEMAIEVMKNGHAKEKLIMGLMQEGAKIWDMDRQSKQWRAILSKTKSLDLWYRYLNFQQTNPITFSYEKCLDTYLEVIAICLALEGDHRDFHCVYSILRLTTFMYEAGHSERAIATWQAILEYNLLGPMNDGNSLQDFETFWESEAPRIGETNAKGWDQTTEQEIPSREDEPLSVLRGNSLFLDWGQAERNRDIKDVLPARTLDETVEDDPYRVILVSDVKMFMFRLKTDVGKTLLVQGFLKFCGLPSLADETGRCRGWWTDEFLCDFDFKTSLGALSETSFLYAPDTSPLYIWNTTGCRMRDSLDFVMRVLVLLADSPLGTRLAEYTIALQLQIDPKAARKLAKSILKRHPTNLLLYNAYALVEVRGGSPGSANKVWATALSMAASLGPSAQQYKTVLWHGWIWELMEQKAYDHVLQLLTEVVPVEAVTNDLLQQASSKHDISFSQTLRAEAYFREAVSSSLTQGDARVVELIALYAMFQYLRYEHDFEEVIRAYRSSLSLLSQQRHPQIVEHLHQLRARHAHLHAASSNSGYRPMQIVPLFKDSLSKFPNDSMFFNFHEYYLRRAGAVDRLRLAQVEEEPEQTSSTYLNCISKEMSTTLFSGSTTHSIRRAFTEATSSGSKVRHCIAVWMSWLRWEISATHSQDNSTQKRVKDVFLSALRSCPWAKKLYLVGFTEDGVRQSLQDSGLEQIYRSMSERGIRIRHDITEMLDDRADARTQ